MRTHLLVPLILLASPALADDAPALYGQIGVDWACSACTGQIAEHLLSVTASSSLKGRYGPANALDGDPGTAWCEGAEGPGVGSWIEVRFKAPVHLDAIQLAGGYFKSAELLAANARPAKVIITLDGGRSFHSTLADPAVLGVDDLTRAPITDPRVWFERTLRAPPFLGVPESLADANGVKLVSSLRLTLDAVHPGKKYSDACISEIGLIFADPKELE